jgi:hypothetical protein
LGVLSLHAIIDARGRRLTFFMTASQVSDYTGAAALLSSLPATEWLIANRCYRASESPLARDPLAWADLFREALKDKGIRT